MGRFTFTQKQKVLFKKIATSVTIAYLSFNAFFNNQMFLKEKEQKESLIIKYDKERESLSKKIDSLQTEKQVLRYQYENVLLQTIENTYDLDDITFPIWRKIYDKKTGVFAMNYLNKAYEDMLLTQGVNRLEYLGNTDYIAHGSDIANEYRRGDLLALNNNNPVDSYERYRKPNGTFGLLKVKKWKVVKGENTFVYGLVLEVLINN